MKRLPHLLSAIWNLRIEFLLFCFCGAPAIAGEALPAMGMIELTLSGRKLEGAPLSWNENAVHLLARDGRLWEFKPEAAANFRQTSDQFRSYSTSELRAELLRELGGDFEVSGTGHYLIAHPRGQRDKWAERFEELYRSFTRYFAVRGFQPLPPPFPLVGIVCKNQRDFQRFSASQGAPVPNGVLGYYSQETNRIAIYDMGGDARRWQENAAVVIHEATHQTAFNTGVHSRYARPPVWVAEGLATLFEARGVYDSGTYANAADRVNRGRLGEFNALLKKNHRPEVLQALVASDRFFQMNPSAGYAEAWALTFFLIETEPRKYARYLALTAGKTPFEECDSPARLADFTAVFGKDWRMLEARFLRFMAEVR
ncbi:MAG: DUF1570 domain-containing protein [Pirellulales bacterium]|nr:DUF1570 domain-containing protein [Pirellulales bacterium]